MRMIYQPAAEALKKRLELVLSEEALALYGEGTKAPKVSDHLAKGRPPFHVWLNPLPRYTNAEPGATMREARQEFAFEVYMFATHSDFQTALDSVNRWANSAIQGIAADATLGDSVDGAVARITDSGFDYTSDKKNVVALQIEVTCSLYSLCPQEMKELVRNAGA